MEAESCLVLFLVRDILERDLVDGIAAVAHEIILHITLEIVHHLVPVVLQQEKRLGGERPDRRRGLCQTHQAGHAFCAGPDITLLYLLVYAEVPGTYGELCNS